MLAGRQINNHNRDYNLIFGCLVCFTWDSRNMSKWKLEGVLEELEIGAFELSPRESLVAGWPIPRPRLG